MPVTTISAAIHITPTVIKTLLKHTKRKGKRLKDRQPEEEEDATDDIFFDEAFHIVKKFIEMGTKNTVESLQAFTNTHVPAPYWAAVSPVTIPLSSCNQAADVLIDWFGAEDLKKIAGGERWWQVRGLNGVEGEWVTEKEYLSEEKVDVGRKLSESDKNIVRMEKLDTVMLYVHGGGYFWGSINTHRYQIIRYARKCKGRAFAVNYRKAPQYPWPCPLQDVIAAYLYLIRPPPDALHKPIPASNIVFAGDSAGGGLCVSVLTILRDMGLPMPAGAALISPWVDLTHSFPSVMSNSKLDIIPQHGFLAKPSTLWPVDPLPRDGARVSKTESNAPPKPGHADTLEPSPSRIEGDDTYLGAGQVETQDKMLSEGDPGTHGAEVDKGYYEKQAEEPMNEPAGTTVQAYAKNSRVSISSGDPLKDNTSGPSCNPDPSDDTVHNDEEEEDYDFDKWEPQPPKVLMNDSDAVPLELRSQIQLYAATEQLTHPLVSPVLQGSLGNLPPLYILAGDGEVLRDEIIYLAHRAANPLKYLPRKGVLRENKRQKENAEKFRVPTKVHLQVFDGMCHVLTVFSFTQSAKYAYRSIAEFTKHVSSHDQDHLERNPFPELHRPPEDILNDSDSEEEDYHKRRRSRRGEKKRNREAKPSPMNEESGNEPSGAQLYKENEQTAIEQVKDNKTQQMPESCCVSVASGSLVTDECDVPNVKMIRERVDIRGKARPMEPENDIPALCLRPAEVGLIKENPCVRWLKGQEEWDRKYKRDAEKAIKQRRKIESQAKKMIGNARDQGFLLVSDGPIPTTTRASDSSSIRSSDGRIQTLRRWGPFDLEDERPPASAIANRRDTHEALALIKKSIYHTAPATHMTVPRMKTSDAIRAAFDPNDDPMRPPRQSVSEQQVRTHIIPIHGLRVWDALIGYFMHKSSRKAIKGGQQTAAAIKRAGQQVGLFNDEDN